MELGIGGRVPGSNFHDRADEPAFVYVVDHKNLDALKVGVASSASRESRLRDHERQGWTTQLTVRFDTGHQALQAERAVLGFLRTCGATSRVPQMDMPQGGYTETIAEPDLVDLQTKDFVQIAELASRMIRKAHCPLYGFVRTAREVVNEVRELIHEGHKDQARKLAEQILPLIHQFLQQLDGQEAEPRAAT